MCVRVFVRKEREEGRERGREIGRDRMCECVYVWNVREDKLRKILHCWVEGAEEMENKCNLRMNFGVCVRDISLYSTYLWPQSHRASVL